MNYELMLVASTESSESLVSRVQKLISEKDGKIFKVDSLGRKRLAYPIKKQTEADYYVVNFEAAPEVVKTISDKLKLEQEDLLRYLLIRPKTQKSKTLVLEKKEEEEIKVKKVENVTVVAKKKKGIKQKKGDLTKSAKKSKSK